MNTTTVPESQRQSQTNTLSINPYLPTPRSHSFQALHSVPLLSPRRPTPTGLPKQLGMLKITRYTSNLVAHHGNSNLDNHHNNNNYSSTTTTTTTSSSYQEEEEDMEDDFDIDDYYNDEVVSLDHQDQGPYAYSYEDESEFYSPKIRGNVYYEPEQTISGYTPAAPTTTTTTAEQNLPPVPTYSESQMAYYPKGIKRLPHFHPQKFSRRLRTLMDQRRKPRPLYLDVEPHTKILLNTPVLPQHQPMSSSPSTTFKVVVFSILRFLHLASGEASYREVRQQEVEDGRRRYANGEEVDEVEEMGPWWSEIDHRVVLIGVLGLLLLGLSITAWTLAVLRA